MRFRSAPLPRSLRPVNYDGLEALYAPGLLGAAIGDLLKEPPPINIGHITIQRVTLADRVDHLRSLLRRGATTFSEAIHGADRVTVCVTLFALLELYKQGEAAWTQSEAFGEIEITPAVHWMPTATEVVR